MDMSKSAELLLFTHSDSINANKMIPDQVRQGDVFRGQLNKVDVFIKFVSDSCPELRYYQLVSELSQQLKVALAPTCVVLFLESVQLHAVITEAGIQFPYRVKELFNSNTPLEKLRGMQTGFSLLAQLAQKLYLLHKAGFAHSDFKHENTILSPEGEALLIDFATLKPALTIPDSYGPFTKGSVPDNTKGLISCGHDYLPVSIDLYGFVDMTISFFSSKFLPAYVSSKDYQETVRHQREAVFRHIAQAEDIVLLLISQLFPPRVFDIIDQLDELYNSERRHEFELLEVVRWCLTEKEMEILVSRLRKLSGLLAKYFDAAFFKTADLREQQRLTQRTQDERSIPRRLDLQLFMRRLLSIFDAELLAPNPPDRWSIAWKQSL